MCPHFFLCSRYNEKWTPKTPVDKRLTDDDITEFVKMVKPIAFHVLFGAYEEDRWQIFNALGTLRPHLIIPGQ